jgi:predicted transposase/invertase (TIGR01784 family)
MPRKPAKSASWSIEPPPRYIDPTTDFGFHYLFACEANKDMLIAFLNSILPKEYRVKTLRFLNTKTGGVNPNTLKLVYDIFCEGQGNEKFIIEMQVEDQKDFEERSISYVARAISERLPRGVVSYKKLKAVIFIGVMAFKSSMRELPREVWRKVSLKNDDNGEFSGKLQMYFLQLPLFKKKEEELKTNADKWFFYLRNLPKLLQIPAVFKKAIFKKAFEIAEIDALSYAKQINYQLALDQRAIWKSVKELAFERGREAGRAKAELMIAESKAKIAESEAKIAEIEAQTDEIGPKATEAKVKRVEAETKRAEFEAKTVATAQRLKARGLSDAEIAEITGLPPEAILRV